MVLGMMDASRTKISSAEPTYQTQNYKSSKHMPKTRVYNKLFFFFQNCRHIRLNIGRGYKTL